MHPWLRAHDRGPPALAAACRVDEVVRAAAVARDRFGAPEDTFAWVWESLLDDPSLAADRARLRRAAEGGALVDLGGGRAGWTLRLAEVLGVRTWVSVDVAHPGAELDPTRAVQARPWAVDAPRGLEVLSLRADAVEAASRWRDVAGIVVLGGLDQDAVPVPDWHEALAEAVAAMLAPGAVVLWTESVAGPLLGALGLEPLDLEVVARRRRRDDDDQDRWLGTGAWWRPEAEG